MKTDEELYRSWLQHRRDRRPDSDLSDRIMASVSKTEMTRRVSRLLALVMWIDRSGIRRLTACLVALAVGSLPFVYLAYISKAFVF